MSHFFIMFYLFDPNFSEKDKFIRTIHFIIIIVFILGLLSYLSLFFQ